MTYYIPNDKTRLIEIPMSSSIYLQMLLYYHYYFDIIYALMLIPSGLFKMNVGRRDPLIITSFILTVLFCLSEGLRLNFGYQGNLNESSPELCAFFLQTLLFSSAFAIVPIAGKYKFPHEDALYFINLGFLAFELGFSVWLMCKFQGIQAAAFYRRTAPLIDR